MLDGIRIIEIEGLGPAPFAAMMLAELGAEVIVIHRPGPAPQVTGEKSLLDRGKRSIILDLKTPEGVETARALIARADGVIEGFRPGVMERLGLGPKVFAEENPRLVYGRMTGWGQTGPKSRMAGHDMNYLATSGALHYASAPGDAPLPPPTLLGDIGGGALYLVAGMLAGLLQAARTGRGTVVDAAIVDGAAHMMTLLMALQGSGNLSERRGHSLLDGPHWSRTYRCAGGGYLSVQALEPQFYATFLRLAGLEGDPLFESQYDPAQWPAQTERLAAHLGAQPLSHWAKIFEGSDACAAPVLSPWEAMEDAHMQARGIWSEGDMGLAPAPAPRFNGATRRVSPPPARGADTEAILAQLREG